MTARRVWVLVFGTLLTASVLPGQDAGKPGPGGSTCDLRRIEPAIFCSTCNELLEDRAVEEHRKTSRQHELVRKRVCVKKYYHAACHPENASLDKGQCCRKDMEERIDRALLMFACEGCGFRSPDHESCPNAPLNCTRPKMRTECGKQAAFPHIDEKRWRAKRAEDEARRKKEERDRKKQAPRPLKQDE